MGPEIRARGKKNKVVTIERVILSSTFGALGVFTGIHSQQQEE
jgi:hypothetical protein